MRNLKLCVDNLAAGFKEKVSYGQRRRRYFCERLQSRGGAHLHSVGLSGGLRNATASSALSPLLIAALPPSRANALTLMWLCLKEMLFMKTTFSRLKSW